MSDIYTEIMEAKARILRGDNSPISCDVVLYMANYLAGIRFTDGIRYLVGIDKNEPNTLKEFEDKFCSGCESKGISSDDAKKLYDGMINLIRW